MQLPELQRLIENWNNTLSNGLPLAPQKGVYADDLDIDLERLYTEHVAPPRKVIRVGAPGNRATIRHYCSQVGKAAGLGSHPKIGARGRVYSSRGPHADRL